jgi:hypothetical protein
MSDANEKLYPLLLPLYGEGATSERIEQDVQKGESLIQEARKTHGNNPTCE